MIGLEGTATGEMKWHCLACHRSFWLPVRVVAEGCPVCESTYIFDCNIEPVTEDEAAKAIQAFKDGKGIPL